MRKTKLRNRLVVVDYGAGNLWSVASAFEYLGASCTVSRDPLEIERADQLILPGVGSYKSAMTRLRDRNLDEPLKEAVLGRQRKILGICLGFQMLTKSSSEDGYTEGLGLIDGSVDRFTSDELHGGKIPHVGFNQIEIPPSSSFSAGLERKPYFYFVHSYRLLSNGIRGQIALCNYGIDFVAAIERENIFGAQFHPEKSQTNGLIFLNNFLRA